MTPNARRSWSTRTLVHYRLDKAVLALLEAEARRRRTSKTSVVETALREHLLPPGGPTLERLVIDAAFGRRTRVPPRARALRDEIFQEVQRLLARGHGIDLGSAFPHPRDPEPDRRAAARFTNWSEHTVEMVRPATRRGSARKGGAR